MVLQIRTADGRQSCQFPQHSTPLVSVGSDCAACDFGCDETFHKRDGKCVCDPSLFECNGRCALVRGPRWLFSADVCLTPCYRLVDHLRPGFLWSSLAGGWAGILKSSDYRVEVLGVAKLDYILND